MIQIYIAFACIAGAAVLYFIGRNHGKRREKAKQQEWENEYRAKQQKQSNETGVRNAKIDSLSIDKLSKRADKLVRD